MIKTIEGFPNYIVNDDGEVWNIKKNKRLTPVLGGKNYYYISLSNKNVKRRFPLQRLVALAFVPGRTETRNKVRFLNRDTTDCRAENLAWASHQEVCKLGNTGSHVGVHGEEHYNSKLTLKQVEEIRTAFNSKNRPTYRQAADEYKVSPSTINDIISGRTWS